MKQENREYSSLKQNRQAASSGMLFTGDALKLGAVAEKPSAVQYTVGEMSMSFSVIDADQTDVLNGDVLRFSRLAKIYQNLGVGDFYRLATGSASVPRNRQCWEPPYPFEQKEGAEKDVIRAKQDAIRAEILEYANLLPDFDGNGGCRPRSKDIFHAKSLVWHIPLAGLNTVRTMTDGGGDVGFEWGRDIDLEIGFMDGNISFYGYTPKGKRIGGTQPYNNVVPEELLQLLKAIFPD